LIRNFSQATLSGPAAGIATPFLWPWEEDDARVVHTRARSRKRRIADRPRYTAVGAVFVAEIVVLAVWGLLTPGQEIPNDQAVLVLGGTALLVVLAVLGASRVLRPRIPSSPGPSGEGAVRSAQARIGLVMTGILGLGALSIGLSVDSVVQIALQGISGFELARLAVSLLGLAVSAFLTIYLIYRLHLGAGGLKRRVGFLDAGWENAKE
jgi:hypothetical protein